MKVPYFETANFYKNQIETWPQICHPWNHRKKTAYPAEGRSRPASSKTFQATPTSSRQAVKTVQEGRNFKGAEALVISPDLLQWASLSLATSCYNVYVCLLPTQFLKLPWRGVRWVKVMATWNLAWVCHTQNQQHWLRLPSAAVGLWAAGMPSQGQCWGPEASWDL